MAIGNAPGNPLSVFLVEDEVMIRMMVSDMLVELGHRVTAEAGDLEQAIRLAQTADFSLAILDVNLADKLSTPVADIVNSLGRPIIFASGYGSSGLPPAYRNLPALQKPFSVAALGLAIEQVMKTG